MGDPLFMGAGQYDIAQGSDSQGVGEFFEEGSYRPAPGPNPLDPLDLRKSGATEAARQAGQLQYDAAIAGIDELRRQFDTTTGRLTPFFQAGLDQLGNVVQGSTVGGLDERLRSIFGSETFGALKEERAKAVNNQLSQAGLMRSGEALRAAAAIPTDVALALEQQLFGRQTSLMGGGQNAAAGLGGFGQQQGQDVATLLGRGGDALAQSAVAQGQIAAQRSGNAATLITGIASKYFSDPRLKDNMAPIGKIGPLTLYEWDWKPEVAGLAGMEMSLGFDADEVATCYPEYVVECAGFRAVDYSGLTDRLRAELAVARSLG